MNEIITKLNEIEEKAETMISDAKDRKQQLEEKLELDKKELDRKYKTLEEDKMKQLSGKLEETANAQIRQQHEATDAAIAELEERFKEHKEELVQEIFERLIAK